MQGNKKNKTVSRGTCVRALLFLTSLWFVLADLPVEVSGQYGIGQIVSEHVRVRVPTAREWLARETIADLERCWKFMNTEAGGKLPRRVQIIVDWDGREVSTNADTGSISIGMNRSEAASDMRAWLLRAAAREMGRLALLGLGGEGAARGETRLLLDAMSEIVAHEFQRTTRSLTGAWVAAHFLDRIQPLGLAAFSEVAEGGRPVDFRASAPGVTFLLTCREIYGREKTLKLFEALGKRGLAESILSVFGRTAAAVEAGWLQKVRGLAVPEEFAARGDEDLPVLQRSVLTPDAVRAGATLVVRLFVADRRGNPVAGEAFLADEASGRVVRGRPGEDESGRFVVAELPIEAGRAEGTYMVRATVIDAAGNIRSWRESYRAVP